MGYAEILLEIARVQRKLLSYSMDWNSRTAVTTPEIVSCGLFGMKKRMSPEAQERLALREKLNNLKAQAEACLGNRLSANRYYWWRLPWEQVEKYLLYNLLEQGENGPWRFETKWESRQKEDVFVLFLQEEGHCSDFRGTQKLEYYETSRYSAIERNDLVQKYADDIKKKEQEAVLWYHNHMVYSRDSDKLYDSMDSYLLSAEHYLNKERQKAEYQRSLSTEHQLNSVTVESNSLHYCCTYHAGEYHISDSGCLDGLNFQSYVLVDGRGDILKELVEYRQKKDPAVAGIAYLVGLKEISCIQISLFGEQVWEGVASEGEALCYAEVLICAAEKLRLDMVSEF